MLEACSVGLRAVKHTVNDGNLTGIHSAKTVIIVLTIHDTIEPG